mgnify:CR=1 FL=1
MLSDHQVTHYKTFGFVTICQVLNLDEIAKCADELERALDADYAHKPFDGTKKQVTSTMGPETPFMASLLEDRRMLNIAEQLSYASSISNLSLFDKLF